MDDILSRAFLGSEVKLVARLWEGWWQISLEAVDLTYLLVFNVEFSWARSTEHSLHTGCYYEIYGRPYYPDISKKTICNKILRRSNFRLISTHPSTHGWISTVPRKLGVIEHALKSCKVVEKEDFYFKRQFLENSSFNSHQASSRIPFFNLNFTLVTFSFETYFWRVIWRVRKVIDVRGFF